MLILWLKKIMLVADQVLYFTRYSFISLLDLFSIYSHFAAWISRHLGESTNENLQYDVCLYQFLDTVYKCLDTNKVVERTQ